MAFKKKLYLCCPVTAPLKVETHRTKEKVRLELSAPPEIERGVRQLLANKISGTLVGIWLLIPEYLRLGTWDLLKSWSGMSDERVEPRLALQLINESALCVNGIRMKRALSQKGFELANGLPFVATDPAIHNLLDDHCVAEAQRLQIALGKVRQTFDHFKGKIIVIDPHRMKSYSKRQMVRRQKDKESTPTKMAQTFFCLDADTEQPLCFTTATSARTATQGTPELLTLAASILKLNGEKPLVLADNEHYSVELFGWISSQSTFDLLTPMPYNQSVLRAIYGLPSEAFSRHWAGYATAKQPYSMTRSHDGPYYQFIQRNGERQQDYDFKAFLCTSDRDEMEDLSINYPQRWHIEEFFKNDQALGWHRAGTMNLNIRYGQMTMALIAQAACFMMRQRLGSPIDQWDAPHLAKDFFRGLEGDIRVQRDTIVVTYYNAPNSDLMKKHYENMPERLSSEGVKPAIPWLYDFKLDFRFK
ncbi:MAG: transposase [Deltaproteobacteria bacterium]|nr:transposase [Deltaproteobacteria bacterium]